MKILAVIVAYNPKVVELNKIVRMLADEVNCILVYDNSRCDLNLTQISKCNNLEYYHSQSNTGLSVAYNYAWSLAEMKGMDTLLIMDQDSDFVGFENYVSYVKQNYNENTIYGPNTVEKNIEDTVSVTEYVINSGMLVPLSVMTQTGGFRKDFFVDGIDEEFCFNAKSKGIKIVRYNNCCLRQVYGEPVECRFLWRHFKSANYSPMRLYGIIRNHIIIMKEYRLSNDVKMFFVTHYMFYIPFKMILGESNKIKKLKAIVYGFIDGLFSRTSKIQLFIK